MRAIVFGGAGFLGSFVADALTSAGHEAVVFDRVSSRYLQPSQTGIVGDILDGAAVAHAIAACDVVYHYAGIADIAAACADPVEAVRVNVLGTTMLLEAAKATAAGMTNGSVESTNLSRASCNEVRSSRVVELSWVFVVSNRLEAFRVTRLARPARRSSKYALAPSSFATQTVAPTCSPRSHCTS